MEVIHLLEQVRETTAAFKKAKELYRDRLAPDFSPFDFIDPDEMRLSRILAWLLCPKGTHGQGGRFLHLFVKQLFRTNSDLAWPLDACEKAKTQTEIRIHGGRLDVHVSLPRQTLVIENKAGAGEQPEQIKRYADYLDSLGQVDTRLVYLTPDGSEPSSIEEREKVRRMQGGQLHCWSYPQHILEWLTNCRAVCRADRVATFIDEFSRYIRRHFEGISDMTAQQNLAHDITQSPDLVAATMQVIQAERAIVEKLLLTLKQQIGEAASCRGWHLSERDWNMPAISRNRHTGFTIRFSHQSKYKFKLEFQEPSYNALAFGLTIDDAGGANPANVGGVSEAISAHVGPGEQNAWWTWRRYASPGELLFRVERDWRSSTAPWAMIPNGMTAETIIGTAGRFRDVLAHCGFLGHDNTTSVVPDPEG